MTDVSYECVGGPLDGEQLIFPREAHDRFYYGVDPQEDKPHGERYQLRRGEDGVRRLYYVRPKGLLP